MHHPRLKKWKHTITFEKIGAISFIQKAQLLTFTTHSHAKQICKSSGKLNFKQRHEII